MNERFISKVRNFELPQSEEAQEKRKNRIYKPLAAIAIGAAVAVSTLEIVKHLDEVPEFSEENTSYILEKGEGLSHAAHEISGIESIDWRDAVAHIQEMPENQEVIDKGLWPGDTITIPTSVDR